jgi:(p)ppGpp synthase/HD superfamily hydrolase
MRTRALLSVAAADALAVRAHVHDVNRAGVAFIVHVRSVASRVAADPDPYAVPAALLHDSVEKGRLEWADLRVAGADDRLVRVVEALTERRGEDMRSYLARCAADPLALRIKRADLDDKLDLTPESQLPLEERVRVADRARLRRAWLEEIVTRSSAWLQVHRSVTELGCSA